MLTTKAVFYANMEAESRAEASVNGFISERNHFYYG